MVSDLFPLDLVALARSVALACGERHLSLATAESCTGGLIAACLTEIPGVSQVFRGGFVTYANEAKTAELAVPKELIDRVGAVSEEVARAMAEGALKRLDADLAVSVTGIAGPDGGTPAKPVGLVHIAAARKGKPTVHERHQFPGDRQAVRLSSVEAALKLALCTAHA
jgi:nicotinamide-nucleotide amidase